MPATSEYEVCDALHIRIVFDRGSDRLGRAPCAHPARIGRGGRSEGQYFVNLGQRGQPGSA